MNLDRPGAKSFITFAERPDEAPFALGPPARSWGDLFVDAAAVARGLERLVGRCAAGRGPNSWPDAALPPSLMVACADRYFMAVALLATWHQGYVAALPPNGSARTIDDLCAARGISLILHDGGGPGGQDVRALMEERAQAQPLPMPRFLPGSPLVCVYTSGSTGAHVACPKTAGQVLGEARLLTGLFAMKASARILATVPPHHIYGLLFGMLVPLMGGGAFVRGTPHHAETIAQLAATYRADILVSVPAHLHGLAALPPQSLSSLSLVFSSGAPLADAVAQQTARLVGFPVTEVYGSSETGGIAWRQAGVGEPWRPFPGITVQANANGVIALNSPFVPSARVGVGEGVDGHDHAGAATTAPFVGADRIVLRDDGRFDLLGRADGVLKIGGSRTSTAEVERRLLEIPGVTDAAVIDVDVAGPRQHQMWAVAVAPGRTITEIRAALLSAVDPTSVPRRFRLVETLPRENSGKLTRQSLLDLFSAVPPAGTIDNAVAAGPGHPRDPDGDKHSFAVTFAADSPYFKGHFDEFPVLPGVVQVNDLVLARARGRWPSLMHLRRIVALKFRSPIRPGDTVAVEMVRSPDSKVAFKLRDASGGLFSSGTLIFEPTPAGDEPTA